MKNKIVKTICDMCEEEKDCFEFEGVGYRVWICKKCLDFTNEKKEQLQKKIYMECYCCGGNKMRSYTYYAEDGWHAAKHCEECNCYENTNESGELVYDRRIEDGEVM